MNLRALQIIQFLHGRVNVGTLMDSPAWTPCWPTAIMARLRQILVQDSYQDGQGQTR